MPTDSRDDVRQRLDEMEATVRGLTQELVEANERIRELEERLDDPDRATKPMPDDGDGPARDGSAGESAAGTDATDTEGVEEEDDMDDIIVA